MIMWMKEDYKGPLSQIFYARKGDQVKVLKQDENMSFIEVNGERFYVRNERLSETIIEADKIIIEDQQIQKLPIKNKPAKTKPIIQQSQLF